MSKILCSFRISQPLLLAVMAAAIGERAAAQSTHTGEYSWASFGTGNYDTVVGIDGTKTFPIGGPGICRAHHH